MILHESDMDLWPDAIYDTKTTNDSFIKYAMLLRRMGVKNYRWCLALTQPELQGVNPHDPTLDFLTRMKILHECKVNPWYLIREVVMVKGRRYTANRGNMALMWLFFNHIDTFLIQPRQTGKSVAVDFLMIWLIYFSPMRKTTIQLITKDASLRTDNISRIKGFLTDMPQYLFVHSKEDPDNTEELGYAEHDMRFIGKVPRSSPADAEKVGRGATSEVIQFDELPYINHCKIIVQAALGSTTEARALAKEKGTPYGILYTTTAGKIDSRDGRFAYDLLCGAAKWTEHLYDAGSQLALEEIITNQISSPAPMVNITLSHRQLGKTDEWLWETMARNKAYGDAAERDYLNRWTNGTGTNPISVKQLQRVNASLTEPHYVEITPENFVVNWYIPRDEIGRFMSNNPTVIGLDTSDAIGRDGIDMVIIDPRTMRPIATGSYNQTSIVKWISFFANFMLRHTNTVWIPERKSSAQSIIDGVAEIIFAAGENPFNRIYNTIYQDKDRFVNEYTRTQHPVECAKMLDTHKSAFGFNTTASSRNLLYVQVLNTILEDASEGILDSKIITQMSGLTIRNGRIDHSTGGHDDSVVAYLLAGWLVLYGKNLELYGITKVSIRTLVENRSQDNRSPVERMRDARTDEIKGRIEELIETLTESDSEFAITRAEQEIKYLMGQLGASSTFSAETVNELITKARQKRTGAVMKRLESGQSFSSNNNYNYF